jgi:hypothetical protein
MVIFPSYCEDGETLFAFSGRHTDRKLFYIHSKNEAFKVFNIFNVNLKENVFIFESIIDSYTVDNSIASLGSDISENILKMIQKPVFCLDNDNTGRIKTLKYLQKGYKCFIPPVTFSYKDFNEAICNGWTKERLEQLVKDNIYEGFGGVTIINLRMIGKK